MPADDAVASWDAEAEDYDLPADHGLRDDSVRDVWRDLLLGLLPDPPASVAEMGCGTGTLSVLLADEGYQVDGVDFSPEMLRRAELKAAGRSSVRLRLGDAAVPPLPEAAYDVVLSRHVLWAMPDPADALRRWAALLRPGGRLVLVEGFWSTGAGLRADQTTALVEGLGRAAELTRLRDPAYWGRVVDDERYVVLSRG
ncbi:MAG: class I SAM-dependent methyltransferase [Nocardioidaceae bacterium]|nr:class I SAM-dependent methyltransferase [Nocardioidaceae bacterium]